MIIQTVRYGFRRNLGDYEHEELVIEAGVEQGDDPQSVINNLKAVVISNLLPRNYNLMTEEERTASTKTLKKAESKASKPKKASPSKEEKGGQKKKLRVKGTPLNPEKQLHKKLFGEVMDSVVPNWRKREKLVKKASKVMAKLAGTEFLDSEGLVIGDFSDLVSAEFAS